MGEVLDPGARDGLFGHIDPCVLETSIAAAKRAALDLLPLIPLIGACSFLAEAGLEFSAELFAEPHAGGFEMKAFHTAFPAQSGYYGFHHDARVLVLASAIADRAASLGLPDALREACLFCGGVGTPFSEWFGTEASRAAGSVLPDGVRILLVSSGPARPGADPSTGADPAGFGAGDAFHARLSFEPSWFSGQSAHARLEAAASAAGRPAEAALRVAAAARPGLRRI